MAANAFTAEPSYDVFLSYNSADHGLVEDIAHRLRDKGLEPFFDRWYLAPGARWRPKLEQTLSSCKAVPFRAIRGSFFTLIATEVLGRNG